PGVLLSDDGKTLRVQGEGVWLVDDSGNVGFQGDDDLDDPPTPVVFGFADMRGNLSNPAMLVMHSEVGPVAAIKTGMQQLDDATFWKNFRKQAILSQATPLAPEDFIAVALNCTQLTLATLPRRGANPVSEADYNLAFAKWVGGGKDWGDLTARC